MKRISLWLLTLLLSVSAYAQSYMLKGTVEDQTGEPLIGASVRYLTSNTGVTTDVDGNFQIPVKNGDKVEISYVGCLAETLTANGQNNIKVVLKENSESLEEVVIIGYGTMKKNWYYKKTDDMIMEMNLPGFSGFGSIWTNIGQVDNTGIEISLSTRNIVTRDFQWTTTAGFSYNKNRIKHLKGTMEDILDDDGNIIGQREASETASKLYINKPIGEIWDYQFDGIWSVAEAAEAARHGQRPGDPKVRNNYTKDDIVNADGTVTPVYNDKDKVYLGTTNPPIYWNLGNEFKFKNNLTFAFSFYSYMGHKSTETTYMNGLNGGSLYTKGFNMFKQEYWTPDNQTNEYGRFESQGPAGVSTPGKLHDRSFVRLDNISIGYTLPEAWTRKAAISKCRFTASVRNVCTIGGDWEYGDPETGGLATRTYNFGLQLSF